jgi:hypothetical protein
MQGAVEGESQDSALLRQALLEAGIGTVSPCPSLQVQPSSTTAFPVMMVEPSQGANTHPAVSTSSQPLATRTTHPPKVGWYRQLIFELAEQPVVLPAEEYAACWPYISSAYTLNKEQPITAAGKITRHYWCRLWSPKTRKTQGKGSRGKTIRVGLGCGFKLKDVIDVASGVSARLRDA